jgi:dTDP-4-dehydrorhamnose reductase
MSLLDTPLILLTGAKGQVGFELTRSLQGLGNVVALDRNGLDLSNPDQVRQVVRDAKPSLIVNAAAYTAVDRAESEEPLAQKINGEAPGVMAEEAKRLGAPLIHYSTDYVFDGASDGPYVETDQTAPLNAYGRTKLAGEQAIAQVGGAHLIFRTSWVYGTYGSNFLLTMLRLARERDELRIVADQIGAPTWSNTIAAITAHVIAQGMAVSDAAPDWWQERSGIYHLTSQGATSWCEFAMAIFAATNCKKVAVKPISSEEYPTPARRPRNSRLDLSKLAVTFGIKPPQWQDALNVCVADPRLNVA